MKKSLKSQLIVAITMTLIATVALTSATYAWFTSIANPEVGNIQLYVKAADNLMLSAYDTSKTPDVNLVNDWKSSISQANITDPTWGNQPDAFPTVANGGMFNVSSLFSNADANAHKFFTATYDIHGAITGYSEVVDQPHNYSKFSLWVKSTKTGDLLLDTNSVVAALAGTTAPKDAIADTVRVGFVPVDETGVENWDGAVVWEPNSTAHLDPTFGGPTDTGKLDTNAAASTSTTALQTTSDFGSSITLFNIGTADKAYNFHVYIWVEGADADAQPAVAKSTFTTYLRFAQS